MDFLEREENEVAQLPIAYSPTVASALGGDVNRPESIDIGVLPELRWGAGDIGRRAPQTIGSVQELMAEAARIRHRITEETISQETIEAIANDLPKNAFVRNFLYVPLTTAVMQIASLGGRIAEAPGIRQITELANRFPHQTQHPYIQSSPDAVNKYLQDLDFASAQLDESSCLPLWTNRTVRGAMRSVDQMAALLPLGPYGIIGGFAAVEFNEALTDAKEARIEGPEKAFYAINAGAIEGGVAGLFQLAGLGGLESLAGKRVVWNGVSQAFRKIGMMSAHELPEELITEVGHGLNRKFSEVDPEALDPRRLGMLAFDTTMQTLMAVGLAGGVQQTAAAAAARGQEASARYRAAQVEAEKLLKRAYEEAGIGREGEARAGFTEHEVGLWARENKEQAKQLVKAAEASTEKGVPSRGSFERITRIRRVGPEGKHVSARDRKQFVDFLRREEAGEEVGVGAEKIKEPEAGVLAREEPEGKEWRAVEGFEEEKIAAPRGLAFAYQYTKEGPGSGLAGRKEREREHTVFELPEMVSLVNDLLGGKYPKIVEELGRFTSGLFLRKEPSGEILLSADIAKGPVIRRGLVSGELVDVVKANVLQEILAETGLSEEDVIVTKKYDRKSGKIGLTFYRRDPGYIGVVLAHEIGHLVDWLPDKLRSRGNILGRIGSLKSYMEEYLASHPGGEKPLTAKEKARLEKIAEQLLREPQIVEEEISEEITKELGPVTADDILAIWRNVTGEIKDLNPELYVYIAQASRAEKKSIVKEALRGEVPEQLKHVAKKAGERRTRIIIKEPTEAEVRKKYAELIAEEVRKRQLLSREQIMDELKGLTQWWSPFDPKDDRKYTKYRHKSMELYADAVSVLLNNPAALQERAPMFYRGFFGWFADGKPEVERVYSRIVDEIRSGSTFLRLAKRGDYRHAREIREAQGRKKITFGTIKRALQQIVVDKGFMLKGMGRRARRAGWIDMKQDPTFATHNAVYSGCEREQFREDIRRKVIRELRTNGVDWDDFNLYLDMNRIIKERPTLAAPRGVQAEKAEAILAAMRDDLGSRQYEALEKARTTMRGIWEEFIVSKMEKANAYNKELMDYIRDNEYYATFKIIKYMDEKYGKGTWVKVHRQVGTFEPNAGPGDAMIERGMELITGLNWNIAKRESCEFLQKKAPGAIKKAQTKWDDFRKMHVFVPTKEKDKTTLYYFDEGKLQAWDVDNWVAVMFRHGDDKANEVALQLARALSTPFRMLYTVAKPGYNIKNIIRDFRRALLFLPGTTLPKQTMRFFEAIPHILRPGDEVIREMRKRNMLLSVTSDISGMTLSDEDNERQMMRFRDSSKAWNERIRNPFKLLFSGYLSVGQRAEMLGKVSSYLHLKKSFPDMDPEEVAELVRTRGGSPPFLLYGTGSPALNTLFFFSNAQIQAWRYDFQSLGERPGQVIWRGAKYCLIPKAIKWMLSSGALISLLGQFLPEDEDDEKILEWAKWMKRQYDNVGEYYMENYMVIPLGLTPEDKTVILKVPMDDTERVIGGMFWKMMQAMNGGEGYEELPRELLEYTVQQAPGLNPVLSIGTAAITFLTGRNPYDWYRGRYVVPETEFKARDSRAMKRMLKWMWNQAGGSILYRFRFAQIDQIRSESGIANTIETLGGTPVISDMVQRFLDVTDQGMSEKLDYVAKVEERQRAHEIMDLRVVAKKVIDREPLTPEEQRIAFQDQDLLRQTLERFSTWKYGSPEERAMHGRTRLGRSVVARRARELQ